MHSHQLTLGRAFGVAFEDGEDFFEALDDFCRSNRVVQGYLPMFLAGFREAEIVGTCEKLNDPRAPGRTSRHSGAARSPTTKRQAGSCPMFTPRWARRAIRRQASRATC